MMLRSFVVLLLTGCAAGFQTVPASDWETVPAAERASLDRAHDAEVARLQAELRAAIAAVTDAQQALVRQPRATAAPAPIAAPGDDWADAMRAHERAKRDARTGIDTATYDWLRARRAWREQRVELVRSELAVTASARELARARAIDHHLLGSDTYDSAEYRHQLADVQERWQAAQVRTGEAEALLERASAALAASKERYAELVRRGPMAPGETRTTELVTAWDPHGERDRNRRLHLVRAVASEPRYLTPPARIAGR